MVLYKYLYHSPCGELLIVADEMKVYGIWFKNQKYFESSLRDIPILKQNSVLLETIKILDIYFSTGQIVENNLILADQGTTFQRRVWKYLQSIPSGEIVTYGKIAADLDVNSAQAVGGAVRKNPWAILVPCHRVLGKDMHLTGYAAGIEKKEWLLRHEGVLPF